MLTSKTVISCNLDLYSLRCQYMMERTEVEGMEIFSTVSTVFSHKA